jgi:hypothetical protein
MQLFIFPRFVFDQATRSKPAHMSTLQTVIKSLGAIKDSSIKPDESFLDVPASKYNLLLQSSTKSCPRLLGGAGVV